MADVPENVDITNADDSHNSNDMEEAECRVCRGEEVKMSSYC